MKATVDPLRKQLRVELDAEAAFDLFTLGMSRWWPLATHSCFQGEAQRVEFEPHAGGRVLEHAGDGRSSEWGRVIVWAPPERFSMTWHPANDPSQATHLEVTFTPEGDRTTLVTLVHSGWEARGESAAEVRGQYDKGWDGVLGRYAGACAHQA